MTKKQGVSQKDARERILSNPLFSEKVSRTKVTLYEMNRLNYYFAVVTFNSVNACQTVFAQIDNFEFESVGTIIHCFDLDDETYAQLCAQPKFMELEANGGYLKDSATEIPEDYSKIEKRASFLSTKPQLCWETEDNSKQRVMREMRLTDDYNVNQLKDYFDMSSSGDESEAEQNREILLGNHDQ